MSKALKTVIAVGVSIAIPFVAPMIAGSAALAGVTASIGMTATSALVGAGIGATSAALTGGDVGRGALMGGLGGGIGGYTAAPGAASTGQGAFLGEGVASGVTNWDAAAVAQPGLSLTAPPTVGPPVTGQGAFFEANVMYPPGGYTAPATPPMTQGAFLGEGVTTGVPFTDAGAQRVGLATTAPETIGRAPTVVGASGIQTPTAGLSAPGTATAQATAQPRTFSEAVRQIPGEIAGRFRDPKALADMTLRAAGTLAGSALAGSGLSSQEQELLNEQVAELRQLRETNQGLFNQRLEQAQNLIGESKYFDPEYFGLQRARRAQIAGAKAKQAGLRGLSGERAQAEARRFDIATGRETGTAFDVGYQSGIQGRLGTMQAGLQAMPGPMQMSPYTSVQQTLTEAERRRRERAGDIGALFGSLTGGSQSQSRGPRPPGG